MVFLKKNTSINFPLLFLVACSVVGSILLGFYLTEIDADITRYLPQNDQVVADAGYIFKNHPIQDQLAIDVGVGKYDPDGLAGYGDQIEHLLLESGLFKSVGLKDIQNLLPELISHITMNLPVFFSEEAIQTQILPRIQPEAIQSRLEAVHLSLLNLDGIGRSALISHDPLGLMEPVMSRLSQLAPTMDVQIFRGKLMSSDGKHLLVVASPIHSGTDTVFARRLAELMDEISDIIAGESQKQGLTVTLTAAGAYRAALDNEVIARQDVNRALWLATLGIACLLIFSFPRPWIGLMAFLPSLAGTSGAFLICAIVYKKLSIMALGFGGAIISITIDYGITYLIFLDRHEETRGREASRKILAVGLIATLTTIGAFGALMFSGFPIFQQLGLFTALGVGFSFVFVHTLFPRIFPVMPAADFRRLPLRKLVAWLASTGKTGAYCMLGMGVLLIFFARPDFNVQLNAMNTVSQRTADADALIARVWGGQIFNKIYLMTEGNTISELQAKWLALQPKIDRDIQSNILISGFIPSMIFPGASQRMANLAAWKVFWIADRVADMQKMLRESSEGLGFSPDAFSPFLTMISPEYQAVADEEIPERFYGLLAIRKHSNGQGWVQVSSLIPGSAHDPDSFYSRYHEWARIFDPDHFSKRLGNLLFDTFLRMLVIVGLSIMVLVFFFFMDWKLTAIALTPVAFALVSTLGTMKLIGHPLDIPGLMLSIIVIGMGVDYSLYLVRSYQRYADSAHPNIKMIHMSVFLSSTSTLIGFGVLIFSQHSLLKSAGLTSFLGIGYSLVGAFLILPPILRHVFRPCQTVSDPGEPLIDRILKRYRYREAYPRLFARFKLRLDPMFSELSRIFNPTDPVRTVLDIGCGYGVPASWVLERYPDARVYGIDPNPERIRIAKLATVDRGQIAVGCAPEIPLLPGQIDLILMLDIIHYLSDDELSLTLQRVADRIKKNGILVIRAVVPPLTGSGSWRWQLEALQTRLSGTSIGFRSVETIASMITRAGFQIDFSGLSGGNRESVWFVGNLQKNAAAGDIPATT
jgi:predicted exporter/SAM-dependent methyltransferase